MEYIAFMAAIKHEHFEYVMDTLKEYDIGAYLVSKEVAPYVHEETGGQHMHFLVQMGDKDYHKFAKRVFVDKFKLRGKASKDKPRQYGRVKKIENLEKMAAYTLKDGNIETNMSEIDLQRYKNISIEATDEMKFEDKIYKHLDEQPRPEGRWEPIEFNFRQLAVIITRYVQAQGKSYYLSRIKLEKLVRVYQLYHLKIDPEAYVNDLFPFKD